MSLPVLLEKLHEQTGVTPESVRGLIKNGSLQEGVAWYKAPNNRIFIDPLEFSKWVKSGYTQSGVLKSGQQATKQPRKAKSASPQPLV